MTEYKVNKKKCLGCGMCVVNCPKGMKIEDDGKAKVIDSKEIDSCGGKNICPYKAIEKTE
jgi:ferredoxin